LTALAPSLALHVVRTYDDVIAGDDAAPSVRAASLGGSLQKLIALRKCPPWNSRHPPVLIDRDEGILFKSGLCPRGRVTTTARLSARRSPCRSGHSVDAFCGESVVGTWIYRWG
jgi:hypothetical protein